MVGEESTGTLGKVMREAMNTNRGNVKEERERDGEERQRKHAMHSREHHTTVGSVRGRRKKQNPERVEGGSQDSPKLDQG